MSFNHYRHNPGWGTQQFQLGAPPLPGYQPLSSWTGQDFYSAHALGADPYLYQNTISRMSSGMGGVGKHEARHWHRRAYAGLGEVAHMMPQEIGIAAAYEAYRQIKYSTNVYQNLYTDYERQREAMRAIAVAEAQRLWYDTGRAMDQYGIQMACDAAAATASRIATEREMEEGQGYGSGLGAGSFRHRRSSIGGYSGSGYAGSGYAGSGYAGSGYAGSGYGGGSVYGGASPLQMAGTLPGTPMVSSPMLPGSPLSVMGGGVPYAGNVGLPASYGGGYGGTYGGGYGGGYGTPGYEHLGLPNAGYPMGGYSAPGTPASGMMVIHQPEGHHRRHSRRHRHHSHSHRRHRSHDRY
jgi:hypothetical protein